MIIKLNLKNFSVKKGTQMIEHSTRNPKVLGSIPSGVEAFLFSQKIFSNIYWKFNLVLNYVNSKSQVDKVDMVEFGYHGEWYTLLIIDIIDWNYLEKFVYKLNFLQNPTCKNKDWTFSEFYQYFYGVCIFWRKSNRQVVISSTL